MFLRKALVASLIILIAISGVLFLRLDPESLSTSVQAQLHQWSGQKIQTKSASLSLLHGISLRIQNVNIQAKTWHLHADSIRLGFSLWHLLQGETDIKSAEIIRPVLDLSKPEKIKNIVITHFPKTLKQIRLRQGNIRISGVSVAQDVDGTLRRVSLEQELTWEVQTNLFGGDFTTQGRILYDTQGRSSVFGKLKARHLHLKDAPKVFTSMSLPQSAYNTLESSLTFDVDVDRKWSFFGDAKLHDSLKKAPQITWRGKVEGTEMQRLNWHDAFFQLGRKTMFSTIGNCGHRKGCQAEITTRDAEIPLILKALNLPTPIKGALDAKTTITWKNGQWSAKGKLTSHHISWSDIAIPDTIISVPDARYYTAGHVELTDVRLQSANESGDIVLDRLAKSGEAWNFDAHIRNMTDAWSPITNILLKSHGMKPDFRGKGPLTAAIHASAKTKQTDIDFSVDSSQTQIAYANDFEKPKGIRSKIVAHVATNKNTTTFSVRKMELGNSRVEQAQWNIEQGKIGSLSVQDMQIDLTELTQQGIVFPDHIKDWHGAIHGHFARLRPSAKTNLPDWFAKSEAQLELTGFGSGEHQWNGLINIHEGNLSTGNLLWKNISQHANFSGNIHLSPLHGNVDMQDASLSWKQGDALPTWLTHANLYGSLHNIDLNWMGNTWGELHGAYRTKGKQITLRKVRAQLADGSVQSPKLSLRISPETVHFSGPVRMAIVRLNKLEGLAKSLGAKLDGYMYLNANLEGDLPWRAHSSWQGNGDIEIQHGHWQPVDKKLTIAAGAFHSELDKTIPFSRFTTRFHLDRRALKLSRIQLESGTKQITGNSFLHPNGEIGGNLKIRDEGGTQKSRLLGNWPEVTSFFGVK